MPREGEPLKILDIDAIAGVDARLRAAVKRLAEEKAPQSVAQLVLWHVGAGIDWPQLEKLARHWANSDELALARQFARQLVATANEGTTAEADTFDLALTATDPESGPLVERLRSALDGRPMLGLSARVLKAEPSRRSALTCTIRLDRASASVRVSARDGTGTDERALGKYSIALADPNGTRRSATEIADALAEGLLDRLVRVQVTPGPRANGKEHYKIRIDNGSPLVLHGLALAGSAADPEAGPSLLLGISLPPNKSLAVPASPEVVQRLKLKEGLRVQAAHLSGL
jgi:hypothetical protein